MCKWILLLMWLYVWCCININYGSGGKCYMFCLVNCFVEVVSLCIYSLKKIIIELYRELLLLKYWYEIKNL